MRRILLIAHLLFLLVCPAMASDPVDITLIPGRYEQGSGLAYFGMKVSMDRGWHTYWKAPGEGGLAPELKVTRAENATGMTMLWPAPSIIRSLGDDVSGYENEVVFPLAVPVKTPGEPVDISLSVTVYACSNICVPFKQEISSRNDAGSPPNLKSSEVDRWINRVPMKAGLSSARFELLDANTSELTLDAQTLPVTNYSQLFLDAGPEYVAQPIYGSEGQATTFVVKQPADSNAVKLRDAHVVVVDNGIPREYALSISAAGSLSLSIVVTAFLGGLILNLMPCVLPVLSLKLVSLTKQPESVRRGFAWSALGIWTSFLVLGLAVLILKSTGTAVGWGVQFQSPAFLGVMSIVTGLFAVSMVDGILLYLPGPLSDRAAKLSMGTGASGSFLQGFVATLLATPCSAPFVGTAAGFAFSAPALPLMAIFCAMGLGMALPYAAIALVPGLQRLVPKPGRWMTSFKVILALLMAGMSGYLASLVGATFSVGLSYALLVGLVVVFVGLLRKPVLIGLLSAAVLSYPAWDYLSPKQNLGISPWVKFQPEKIGDLVSEGKTVVVDVTAKWCITCKVNDQTVWNRDDVGLVLKQGNVVAMRGDWTKPDPAIAAYLKTFNRYGLPFNIVYSPAHPRGMLLPELLSKKDILDAVNSGVK